LRRSETDAPPLSQTAWSRNHEAEPSVITCWVERPCVLYMDDVRRQSLVEVGACGPPPEPGRPAPGRPATGFPANATLLRVWSLWSENSVLSICSQDSILSVGSAASFASFASIGSFASAGSIASAMSAASLLSYQSAGSALSHQSNGSVLSSQANHALRGHRTDGRVLAGVIAAGVLTVLAGIALHRTHR